MESLQGMCCIEKLTMKNCRLLNTTLVFECSTEDADIEGTINSVLTPSGGAIRADRIEKPRKNEDPLPGRHCRIKGG